jgi:hypothetical protein
MKHELAQMRTQDTGGAIVNCSSLSVVAVVLSLFILVSGTAVTSPPMTALAHTGYPDIAGTSSSMIGVARWAFGGLTAPLVGLGGSSAITLGLITLGCAVLAAVFYATSSSIPLAARRPATTSTSSPGNTWARTATRARSAPKVGSPSRPPRTR